MARDERRDPAWYCKARQPFGCCRQAVRDGYCRQCHPEAVHERELARQRRSDRLAALTAAREAVIVAALAWDNADLEHDMETECGLSEAIEALRKLMEHPA